MSSQLIKRSYIRWIVFVLCHKELILEEEIKYILIKIVFFLCWQEIESTLDIAASIKALARSVHGEAVFGDLPRPRLRSQI